MKSFFTFILACFFLTAYSQEVDKPKDWSLNGYTKYLHSVFYQRAADEYFTDQLIHNRIKFKWFVNEKWSLRAELRSRIFFGDVVQANPIYADFVEQGNNDYLDLSVHLINDEKLVFNTTVDRLYFEYFKDKTEIRIGRQRINWGINTIWNPNDIFNAYAFTDFDYEERPGSDAIRIKQYLGFASSIEFAVKAFRKKEDAVAAALYTWNKSNYDFQLLAGIFQEHYVLGGGWAGSLKNTGFKGELSWFVPWAGGRQSVSATTALEHSLKSGLILSFGYLYNSNGQNSGSITEVFSSQLSAKNLYAYKHSLLLSLGVPLNPLLNGGLNFIYSPGKSNALFVNPTISYGLGKNWDLTLVAQIGMNQENQKYVSPLSAGFVRIKNSF